MSERASRLVAVAAAAILVAAALGACGVSSSGDPVDIGEPARAGGGFANDTVRTPELPDTGNVAELVRRYLRAAAGADDRAAARMREFLTAKAAAAWRPSGNGQQPSQVTIIRFIEPPDQLAAVDRRTPVEVVYQVVGSLNDQGSVDLQTQSGQRTMTFEVVPQNGTGLRIDAITGDVPEGLMITDDVLNDLYRPQPIYFWDSTDRLVPDLRYLPLTLSPDQRAQRVVQWLVDGPSPWLLVSGFAQRLPTGTAIKEGVTNENGTWNINLSVPAGTGDANEGIRHLYYQLQWSLRVDSTPSIQLSIEGKVQAMPGAADDYLRYNTFHDLDDVRQPDYDIVDGKVVALDTTNQPNMLKAKENANVVSAAVNRFGDTAAVVRVGTDGKRSLQFLRPDGSKLDAANVPRGANMGRPIWIPGNPLVLVAVNGQLFVVAPNGQGREVTPPKRNVTSTSVAPDGRRIAWVEGGQTYVAPLLPDEKTGGVTIGNARPLLAGQLTASAVAWTGEAWLYVVGTATNGQSAMWRTTLDSGLAENVTALLGGIHPTDVVALATSLPADKGQVKLFTSDQHVYNFSGSFTSEDKTRNPFFVT